MCLINGGAVAEAGHSCLCEVQMGNSCALFKGVLIDVMLSIPLIQGTKKGFYLMAEGICCTPSVDLDKSRRGQQIYILKPYGVKGDQ